LKLNNKRNERQKQKNKRHGWEKKQKNKKKEYLLEKKIVRLLILDNSQPAIRKGGG